MKYCHLKRAMDVTLALIFIALALPFCFAISFLIKLDSSGPVLFSQKRVGKNGELFILFKFRTMEMVEQPDHPKHYQGGCRITKFGRFLRKTSLDEIPQLFNVLKGEMSLIGPRPVVPNEAELVSMRMQKGIYAIQPGISGWAQVNGRDMLTLEQKVELDQEYIEKMGFLFDLRCIMKTVGCVLMCKDVQEGSIQATVENGGKKIVLHDDLVYIGASEKSS